MEFHNVGLLPSGLPEIISALTPYEVYPNTKVMAYPRKGMGPRQHRNNCLGYAGFDDMTDSPFIGLYPTLCCSNGGHGADYRGTRSFKLWMGMLSTTLHEIGHLATFSLYCNLTHHAADEDWDRYRYVEDLAEGWKNRAMARILRDNPRLGQPLGALTGYPGLLAYRIRNWGRPWTAATASYTRITEWRALGCEGQITMLDMVAQLAPRAVYFPPGAEAKDVMPFRSNIYRVIHKSATALGIQRAFVNKDGRCYRMFNAGEAELICQYAITNYSAEIQREAANLNGKVRPQLLWNGIPYAERHESHATSGEIPF